MIGDVDKRIPILLLKTKSSPTDAYEDHFLFCDEKSYRPIFVPVLEHKFKQDVLDRFRRHILDGDFVCPDADSLPKLGALIFTSQRAVEAFAKIVESIREDGDNLVDSLLPESVPLYVVGPATARGLRSLSLPGQILGEETGNGQALAAFIQDHYNDLYRDKTNPAIMFLVGEIRRDVIPSVLQSEGLSPEQRTIIHELVTYETEEMSSFKTEFSSIWQQYVESGSERQWVVVFSPTGCKAMLESLGILDASTGKTRSKREQSNIYVATIGPTTYEYLVKEFDFVPDVCSAQPTPEGVAAAIRSFHLSRK